MASSSPKSDPGSSDILIRHTITCDDEGRAEFKKMLSGKLYNCFVKYLGDLRAEARRLTAYYNSSIGMGSDMGARAEQIREIFGSAGDNVGIEAPLRVDYGVNISVGKNFYANFDCVFLDVCKISFGDDVLLGPGVHFYTAEHPLDSETRHEKGLELGLPITVGSKVWIGGKAIVLAGTNIGDGCVIGAGSVVTKDIAPYSLAVGNPAKVIRELQ